jgi:LPS export ABC transporter protein LptC
MLRLCGIIIMAALLGSCTNDIKEVMALQASKKTPTQVGDSITLLYTDSASLKVMIKANRMLVYEKNVSEPFTVLNKGLFITFFDEEEKISSTLRAKFGVRFTLSKRMEARYSVEVVNKKGEKLETERLVWDEGNNRIYTDAFVKVTTEKVIISGTGFESNQDFTRWKIKNITGTIQRNKDEL